MVEYVDRPARPRPPLLGRHRQDHRARLAQAAHARRGARRRPSTWYRDNRWWWEPLKAATSHEGPRHGRGRPGRPRAGRRCSAPHEVIACTHAELDVGDRDAVLGAITALRPDAIVHCAAWTDVDGVRVRSRPRVPRQRARRTATSMEAARRVGAYVVALSTDYVFDGEKDDAVRRVGHAQPAVGLRRVEAGGRVRDRSRLRGRAHVVGVRPPRRRTW